MIAIDLNPLSRTSRFADISIVDDVQRTFNNNAKFFGKLHYLWAGKCCCVTVNRYVSDLTFIMGPLTAIYAYRYQTSPFKFMSDEKEKNDRQDTENVSIKGIGYGAFLTGLSYK